MTVIHVPDYFFVPLAENPHTNIRTYAASTPRGLLVQTNSGPAIHLGSDRPALPSYTLLSHQECPRYPVLFVDHTCVPPELAGFGLRLLARSLRLFTTQDFAFRDEDAFYLVTLNGIKELAKDGTII